MDFTTKEFLKNLYNKNKGKLSFKGDTKEELLKWRTKARGSLRELMGFNRLPPFKPDVRVIGEVCEKDFIKRKLVLSSCRGLNMPFYKLSPLKGGNNVPVIALHGHGCGGKEGLVNTSKEDRFNYSYALDFVKMGCDVFVPDLAASGERLEEISVKRGEASSCGHINNVCAALGFSLQTLILAELMCLGDYIEGLGCDLNRLSVVGFSGGGLTALLLAALDVRFKLCYVSGYFHGFGDTILYNNLCGCNFVPHLWESFDMGDLGALVCPRSLITEYGKNDSLNGERGEENALEAIADIEKAYDIMGAAENLAVFRGEGEHRFYGLGYDFVKNILKI